MSSYLLIEVGVGYSQFSGFTSVDSSFVLKGSVREIPSLSAYGTLSSDDSTSALHRYRLRFGLRSGLIQLNNAQILDPMPDGNANTYAGTAQTFQLGGMVGLGDLPGGALDSVAFDISADGSVVVGRAAGARGAEAFRWTEAGGMVGLGDVGAGATDSQALAVSADGSVIVGSGARGAIIWDAAHGVRDLKQVLTLDLGLDLTGWNLFSATGVSADGHTIVGRGSGPGGLEGWVAVVPEPASAAALWAGAAGLLLSRSRRRRS